MENEYDLSSTYIYLLPIIRSTREVTITGLVSTTLPMTICPITLFDGLQNKTQLKKIKYKVLEDILILI